MQQIKWIINFWKPYKFRALLIVALTFVYGGFTICYPLIFKFIIDSLNRNITFGGISTFVLILFVSGTLMALVYMYLQTNRLNMNLTLERDIRDRIYNHMTGFGSRFFQKFGTGDIVTRHMDELEQLCHLSSSGIFRLLQVWLTIVFTVAALMALNAKLAVFSTMPLILVFAFYIVQDRDFFAKNKVMRDAVSAVNDAIETCFSGIQVVKSYCTEPHQQKYFGGAMKTRFDAEVELLRLEQRMTLLYGFMSQVGMFVIVFYGGMMVLKKEITLGSFVAFSNYIMVLAGPLMELGWFLTSFRKGSVTIDRLMQIENEAPQVAEAEKPVEPDFGGKAKSLVRFSNVDYSYGEEFSLSGVSFDVGKSEKVAIVGAFGSGKSTVLKMMMRFFDPDRGSVAVAGTDLRNARLASVRSAVGYVPQDCYLFSDTIIENISFGRKFTEEQLEKALETACLKDTIATFRRGLDEEIGIRGLSLSGGQKQRVSIARALLTSPAILLLDDATSSLDSGTEDLFWDSIERNYPGVTVVFASHRMNTIRRADRVIVLSGGRVADSGSYDELDERSEEFRKLMQSGNGGGSVKGGDRFEVS